jgi:hypothetical protein
MPQYFNISGSKVEINKNVSKKFQEEKEIEFNLQKFCVVVRIVCCLMSLQMTWMWTPFVLLKRLYLNSEGVLFVCPMTVSSWIAFVHIYLLSRVTPKSHSLLGTITNMKLTEKKILVYLLSSRLSMPRSLQFSF